MALVYPFANGLWSATANWYSAGAAYGSVPLDGDTVCLNGKTVTLDVSTNNLAGITTVATSPAAAGGSITANIGGYTINVIYSGSTGIVAGTSNVVNVTHTSGLITINARVQGGTAGYGINATASGNLDLNGDIYAVTNYSGVNWSSSGTLNYTGKVNGSTINTSGFGLLMNGTGTVNITGKQSSNVGVIAAPISVYGSVKLNIYGDLYSEDFAAGSSYVVQIYTTFSGKITVYGNLYFGSNASANSLLFLNNGGECEIIGGIYGGGIANKYAIFINTINSLKITGVVVGGSVTPAIYVSAIGTTIDITGNITASNAPAINNTVSTVSLKVSGNITNVGKIQAIYSQVLQISDDETITSIIRNNSDDGYRTLYTNPTGFPLASNVRKDSTYGQANEFTGTLAVPTPAQVLIDVPTDDTVGTFTGGGVDYDLIASSVWNKALSELTTVNSVGEHVASLGTIDNVAIATAVWDKQTNELTTIGSTGERFLAQASADYVGQAITTLN